MFSAIARFAVRYRWVIVVAWVIAVPVLGKALPSLSSVTQSSNASFSPASAPSAQAGTLAAAFEGANPSASAVLVAVRADGPLTAADAAAIARAEEAVRAVPGVTAVHDGATSPDGHAHEAVIATSSAQLGTAATDLVDKIRATFPAAHPPAGLAFHLTGPLAETADFASATKSSAIAGLSVLFIVVLLVIVFRAALAPLLVLIPAGSPCPWPCR
jgi:putative drug exporter of the RND superfamily